MQLARDETEYDVGLVFHHMSIQSDNTYCLDKSELVTCLHFPCVLKP